MIACRSLSSRPLAAALVGMTLVLAPVAAQAQTVGDVLKAPAPAADPVVARIDAAEMKRSDVVRALQGLPAQVQQMPMDTLYPLLLERMIDARLMVNAARADKMQDSADVKRRMAEYEERVLQETYLEKAVRAKISDDMLKKRYDAFVKENPPQDELRARHILVADEKIAKAIIADLNKGQDFAKIAREKSTDGSAKEGGDLGFFTEGDMVAEFSSAAFKLKPGEYTKEPVKTQFGYHVIKAEERRKTTPPAFDEVKEQMTAEMSQELIAEVIDGLRSKAKIEKLGFDGKPLPAAAPKAN